MAREYLTHEAQTDAVDHTTMHLTGMTENSATVFFDGDTEDTATMSMNAYDKLDAGEFWECVGFVEV